MIDSYRLLLERAARLYERYEAERPKPFNVFSVLRTESDEVNLHSRFLHALLDYKKPAGENRENLTDFFRHVGVKDFEQRGVVRVERERDNIDILITNDDKQAVLIENKIWAGDQWRQLCRYYNTLKDQGYGNIHVLYLTLNGDDPSEHSFCGCHCEALSYEAISYKNTLPDWLEGCQQRAYDEPELRESVAQYRQLVQKLTGTDLGRAYMDELMALCLEGEGSNLARLLDLHEVLYKKVRPHLLQELWCDIDATLRAEIADLPPLDKTLDVHASEEMIQHFFTSRRDRYHGLYYSFGNGATLGVEAGDGDRLIFGTRCRIPNDPHMYDQLRNAVMNIAGGRSSEWWPWFRFADGLKLNVTDPNFSSKAGRKEHAQGIARDLKPLWEAVKNAGLAGQHP